jgi:hypothetical protein
MGPAVQDGASITLKDLGLQIPYQTVGVVPPASLA